VTAVTVGVAVVLMEGVRVVVSDVYGVLLVCNVSIVGGDGHKCVTVYVVLMCLWIVMLVMC
jgi:hypothetical protein